MKLTAIYTYQISVQARVFYPSLVCLLKRTKVWKLVENENIFSCQMHTIHLKPNVDGDVIVIVTDVA